MGRLENCLDWIARGLEMSGINFVGCSPVRLRQGSVYHLDTIDVVVSCFQRLWRIVLSYSSSAAIDYFEVQSDDDHLGCIHQEKKDNPKADEEDNPK